MMISVIVQGFHDFFLTTPLRHNALFILGIGRFLTRVFTC